MIQGTNAPKVRYIYAVGEEFCWAHKLHGGGATSLASLETKPGRSFYLVSNGQVEHWGRRKMLYLYGIWTIVYIDDLNWVDRKEVQTKTRQRHSSASYQSSLKNARALVTQHFSFAHELGFPLPNFTWHTYSHETQLENMVIFVFVFDSWLVLIVIPGKEAHSQISWASSTERVWHFTVFHNNESISNNLIFYRNAHERLKDQIAIKREAEFAFDERYIFFTWFKLSLNSGAAQKNANDWTIFLQNESWNTIKKDRE